MTTALATVPAPTMGRRARPAGRRRLWERGGGYSAMAVLIVPVVILMVGLVVDTGTRLAAIQQAEAAADGAAGAGLNAAAGGRISGQSSTALAVRRAQQYLAAAGVDGTVRVEPGQRMVVTTAVERPTQYLALIGIATVTGRGESTVILVPGGG